eukprot:TRINITY_DN489_c2_g2_i1.p2 TRINITY_DN489_c2_g2~~TRINITY_DN489_c2_g2_i1.p2  ORF type:complete len:182 (+),score=26.56 TRINITY_DN489_c2_g2_i1:74-619(+)
MPLTTMENRPTTVMTSCRECNGPHQTRGCNIRKFRFEEGEVRNGIEREVNDRVAVLKAYSERYIEGLKIGEEEQVQGKDHIRFKKRVVVQSFSVINGVDPEPTRICALTNGKLAEDARFDLFHLLNRHQERLDNFDAMWKTVLEHPELTVNELPFDDSWDDEDCRQFSEEFEEFASLYHCS